MLEPRFARLAERDVVRSPEAGEIGSVRRDIVADCPGVVHKFTLTEN